MVWSWYFGSEVPGCCTLGLALALRCSLTPGLWVSFGRVTCIAWAVSVSGLWTLGFGLAFFWPLLVWVGVVRAPIWVFSFSLPFQAGACCLCVWVRVLPLSRLFWLGFAVLAFEWGLRGPGCALHCSLSSDPFPPCHLQQPRLQKPAFFAVYDTMLNVPATSNVLMDTRFRSFIKISKYQASKTLHVCLLLKLYTAFCLSPEIRDMKHQQNCTNQAGDKLAHTKSSWQRRTRDTKDSHIIAKRRANENETSIWPANYPTNKLVQ